MDPDEALRLLREYAGEIFNAREDNVREDDPADYSNELAMADTFVGLDEWLTKGGFLPSAWHGTAGVSVANALAGLDALARKIEVGLGPNQGAGLLVLVGEIEAELGKR